MLDRFSALPFENGSKLLTSNINKNCLFSFIMILLRINQILLFYKIFLILTWTNPVKTINQPNEVTIEILDLVSILFFHMTQDSKKKLEPFK